MEKSPNNIIDTVKKHFRFLQVPYIRIVAERKVKNAYNYQFHFPDRLRPYIFNSDYYQLDPYTFPKITYKQTME